VDYTVRGHDVGLDHLLATYQHVAVSGLVDLEHRTTKGGDFGRQIHGENVGGGELAVVLAGWDSVRKFREACLTKVS
jgi:hypothetical protein